MRTILALLSVIIIMICQQTVLKAQVLLDLETGVVSTGYNNVRIPGDVGTPFSMKDDLNTNPRAFYRIRLNFTFKSRHTLSLLYAPLQIKSEGQLPNDLFFEGVTFPAYTDIEGIYKFNSYRLTYRYTIVLKPRFEFGLGFTAKIRDAKIALASPTLKSEKTNVGFVPIINFRLWWHINDNFGILLDGDALAAPQGRAEDVLIAGTYRISDRFGLKAGYRILEGGAENDEVYNFALFNYASVGLIIKL